MNPNYLVVNENALGYAYNQTVPFEFGVLHGSILKGGPDWKNGPITVTASDTYRLATVKDFEDYRVVVPPNFA